MSASKDTKRGTWKVYIRYKDGLARSRAGSYETWICH